MLWLNRGFVIKRARKHLGRGPTGLTSRGQKWVQAPAKLVTGCTRVRMIRAFEMKNSWTYSLSGAGVEKLSDDREWPKHIPLFTLMAGEPHQNVG